MIDLTKINKPFGELDDATKGALLLAKHNGAKIETAAFVGRFYQLLNPEFIHDDQVYRVAPPPVIPMSVDWSVFKPNIRWIAADEDDEVYAFEEKPCRQVSFWGDDGSVCISYIQHLASFQRGTVDWKYSLLERPEGV